MLSGVVCFVMVQVLYDPDMPHAGCLLDSAWQDTIVTHMEQLLQEPSPTAAAGGAAGVAGSKGSGSKGLVSRARGAAAAAAAGALKAAGGFQPQRLVTRC
jgi:hypothetical protein